MTTELQMEVMYVRREAHGVPADGFGDCIGRRVLVEENVQAAWNSEHYSARNSPLSKPSLMLSFANCSS